MFFRPYRRETAQVRGVLQGVQPVVQPDHAFAQALRVQTVPVRSVRQGVPAKGGPAPTPGEPASRIAGRPAAVSHHQHHGDGGRGRLSGGRRLDGRRGRRRRRRRQLGTPSARRAPTALTRRVCPRTSGPPLAPEGGGHAVPSALGYDSDVFRSFLRSFSYPC